MPALDIQGEMHLGDKEVVKAYLGDICVYEFRSLPPAPSSDYETKYLTLEALASGTFAYSDNNMYPTIYYRKNSGSWTAAPAGSTFTCVAGDIIELKGNVSWAGIGMGGPNITGDCNFNVYGNALSLVHGDNFYGQTMSAQYGRLFSGATTLISAENMIFPGESSSGIMCTFAGCSNLIAAPTLSATSLCESCYYRLFRNCTSLTKAPVLPATTLANYCYEQMFNGCTSLNEVTCMALNLQATDCTYNWLQGVASSGTFKCPSTMVNLWSRGVSGVPTNWTIQGI